MGNKNETDQSDLGLVYPAKKTNKPYPKNTKIPPNTHRPKTSKGPSVFTYYLCVLMAHACFCLRVFGFSPTNSTKRAERPHNQNRFHSSSKGKTRWVMTSIAFLYRRLHVSSVFRHQITSQLCYRHGFIVNGCRFTCQTTPPFMICNLSAVTLPTWLPRFRWISRTKQKCLDRMFRASF